MLTAGFLKGIIKGPSRPNRLILVSVVVFQNLGFIGKMEDILDKVKKTIQEYNLFERKEKILIAYSGGVDSTGLLNLLMELQEEWHFELFLGHFNHRLRLSADEDEQFVRNTAREYSLPLFVDSRDVRSYAMSRRLNLEEAGRILRYDFLKKTAFKIDGAKIATGHTMTDQAETFLMRIMRGSGLRGLASIFPVVEGMIIRPLIRIEREEIEVYLKKEGKGFRVDESNFDRRFLRNRIRLMLVPCIKENFEPKIIPHIGKLVSILQEEEALLEKMAKEEAQKAILQNASQFQLDLKFVSSLPLGLARRVVRDFVLKSRGNLRGISFEDVESILRLDEGKERQLKKDLVLRRENDLVFLKREAPPRIKFKYLWSGEKPLEIREVGLRFDGQKRKSEDSLSLDFNDDRIAFLDWEKLKFPLLVRNRKEGDRYQPLGAPGKKKLKEIMRAKGIPLQERVKRPVILSGEEIVWVLGLSVSEKFKVSNKTEEVFIISVSRLVGFFN